MNDLTCQTLPLLVTSAPPLGIWLSPTLSPFIAVQHISVSAVNDEEPSSAVRAYGAPG